MKIFIITTLTIMSSLFGFAQQPNAKLTSQNKSVADNKTDRSTSDWKRETTNGVDTMKQEQFIVSQSRLGFAETVEKLSEKILAIGWKISVVHDLQETLGKNGKIVLPIKVIELCKPEYSGRMLEVDSLRIYSPLMPCRISVYQTSDGSTFISRMNSGAMASQIGGLVEQVMGQAFKDIEQVLSTLKK